MVDLSAAIKAKLAGHSVRISPLVYMAFKSGDVRTWPGIGELKTTHSTLGTSTWIGNGGLISVSDIDLAAGFFASTVTVTLSGVPEEYIAIYGKAMNQEDELKRRRISIFAQVFDDNWQPLGDYFAIWSGIMDKLTFKKRAGDQMVTLNCETPFVSRRRPRYGFLTDEDQQKLYPGDLGLRFVTPAASKNIKWPSY